MKKRILSVFTLLIIASGMVLGCGTNVYGKEKKEIIICIDPGHQEHGDGRLEPMAPWSNLKKPRVSSGTAGVWTKNKEYQINLEVGMMLKSFLEKEGYKVVMTRENNKVSLSNRERAEISNNAKADLTLKLHCDGSKDGGKRGASILIPSSETKELNSIYMSSKEYGDILKNSFKEDGIKINGVFERKDMTGFNWSQRPVVILEMGFMSNFEDDKMLGDKIYQEKIVNSIIKSINKYVENK